MSWDWPLQANEEVVKVINTSDRFEVGLDAAFFGPKDVEVKVINDNLLVECHQQRTGDPVTREVRRTYKLPSDVDPSTVRSRFDERGVIQITAKKRQRRLF
uniref:SHSP domain-containing protein n=1 Tax=Acrobeloides nanus TaxID=290746 RepID=A0A914E9Q5_9BILA